MGVYIEEFWRVLPQTPIFEMVINILDRAYTKNNLFQSYKLSQKDILFTCTYTKFSKPEPDFIYSNSEHSKNILITNFN